MIIGSPSTWFSDLLEFHCKDCGCEVGFRSRPRTFSERCLLPLLLLRAVRCEQCFRRDYRSVFTPVQPGIAGRLERLAEAEQRSSNVA